MNNLMNSHTISISIGRSPEDVFDYASNPDKFEDWGKFRIDSMRRTEDYIFITAPRANIRVEPMYRRDRFTLDEVVRLDPYDETLLVQRIVPNGHGAEYMITLFQPERMNGRIFENSILWMRDALIRLKRILEGRGHITGNLMPCEIITVSIDRDPGSVFEFVSQPESLPQWARMFCKSIEPRGDEWYVQTAEGRVRIRFDEDVATGVLDHYILPDKGVEFLVPMRVAPNNAGSEVIFTLFHAPDMTVEQFAMAREWVRRDLNVLKDMLKLRGFEKAA
jgi:uncharacterized protein YndB with AHSA1/START domain